MITTKTMMKTTMMIMMLINEDVGTVILIYVYIWNIKIVLKYIYYKFIKYRKKNFLNVI